MVLYIVVMCNYHVYTIAEDDAAALAYDLVLNGLVNTVRGSIMLDPVTSIIGRALASPMHTSRTSGHS